MVARTGAVPNRSSPLERERKFFLAMACVMAAAIAAGFTKNLVLGVSSFAMPLLYHVHAVAFFGWVALYLLQNALVVAGSVPLHRRLGWLAAGGVPVLLVLGLATVIVSLREHGGTPPRPANDFLFVNSLIVVGFAGLATAAIVKRRDAAWHRRLMYGSMAVLTEPGVGRLLPGMLVGMTAGSIVAVVALMFVLAGIVFDLRRSGRVHPAWWWGGATILAVQLIGSGVAFSPLGFAATRAVLAGTAGEQMANIP
jgi:hypothetical protein